MFIEDGALIQNGVSVIVCTAGSCSLIEKSIESLLDHLPVKSQLILVDQSDENHIQSIAKKWEIDDRVTRLKSQPLGLSYARNLGLKYAMYDHVIFTDDDCTASASWIEEMARLLQAHRDVAIIFCTVKAAEEYAHCDGFTPEYRCQQEMILKKIHQKLFHRTMGAGMGINRPQLEGVGFFDDLLGAGAKFRSAEDLDIALRVLAKGGKVGLTNRTYVIHHGFRTWAEGRELAKRDWYGVGAVVAKFCKVSWWRYGYILLYELVHLALYLPLRELWQHGKVRGVRNVSYFWQGFRDGWKADVDPIRLKYIQSN